MIDEAGNRGPQAGLRADLDYFDCDQARANAGGSGDHRVVSSTADPQGICAQCHQTSPATTTKEPTKRGVFVSVLVREAKSFYWCRRP